MYILLQNTSTMGTQIDYLKKIKSNPTKLLFTKHTITEHINNIPATRRHHLYLGKTHESIIFQMTLIIVTHENLLIFNKCLPITNHRQNTVLSARHTMMEMHSFSLQGASNKEETNYVLTLYSWWR